MKRQLIFMAMALQAIAISVSAGIYRHDVSPEKYKKLAAGKQFDCVGLVMDNLGQNSKGSCVLIGNKYVLSAAHVFMARDIRVDTMYIDKSGKKTDKLFEGGATVLVNTPVNERPGNIEDYSFRFKDRRYYGKRYVVNRTYLDSLRTGNIFCADIILIELSDTVAGISPATINTGFDEKNAIITGVGYGASGPADKPGDVGPYMEKIAGQNVVDDLDGFEMDGRASMLASDFDHPTRKDCNRMGSAKPLPLEWAPGGGDSGGGLFRQVQGRWLLVGIITGGSHSGLNMEQYMKTKGYYGGITENVRVSVFTKWIRETMFELEKDEMRVDLQMR